MFATAEASDRWPPFLIEQQERASDRGPR